jgi:hypothetical protein
MPIVSMKTTEVSVFYSVHTIFYKNGGNKTSLSLAQAGGCIEGVLSP